MNRERQTDAPEPPAREKVYRYTRERILRGIFPAGSFIEEGHIATAMGVSRTPVREAFHRLEAEKFIDLPPRRGALVRHVTAQELAQLYELRRLIEGYAVARICQQNLPVPEAMEVILAEMDRLGSDDFYQHVELDRNFHAEMVSSLHNDVLMEVYESLGSRQQRVAMTALGAKPGRMEKIQNEHRALLDALHAHDEDAARSVLEHHLRPVVGVVSKLPGYALIESFDE